MASDKERLDWLESGDGMPGACTDYIHLGYHLEKTYATLREAIDAAMAEEASDDEID